ncbi:MAG TPA: hypothetical protein VIY28_06225, partial [Pseudonocardiaceae bacterium]
SCGVCFGCVLRRASFRASGVTDLTEYIAPSSDAVVQKWLDGKSVEQPVRNFIRRGVRGQAEPVNLNEAPSSCNY